MNVARLPFDAGDCINTVKVSVKDVLRYPVVNLNDAAKTLNGFPFDNSTRIASSTATSTPPKR